MRKAGNPNLRLANAPEIGKSDGMGFLDGLVKARCETPRAHDCVGPLVAGLDVVEI